MITKLGPFQILEEVGRGGMGTVYRGLDPVIGRPVAIKVIRLVGYNDPDEQHWMRGRLFREARAAGRLCHPGIVTIYQVGEDEDVAYIAMEFVDGPTLKNLIENRQEQDKGTLCRILVEAAAALDYAHARGLVHRDIKPENIMVTAAGVTKVTDFGIAKTMLGKTATRTEGMAGTPLYMSPEQIRGKQLDGRSDQFALAVIAYKIFTGRAPFEAEQVTGVCYQIIHEEPPSPEDLVPGIGGAITAVLKRGLAKEPEARFSTCTEFATALLTAYGNRQPSPGAGKNSVRDNSTEVVQERNRAVRGGTALFTAAILIVSAGLSFTRVAVPKAVEPMGRASESHANGVLVWTGHAQRGDVLTISGSQSSSGALAGALPARPVRIKVYAAGISGEGLTAFTADSTDSTDLPVSTPHGPALLAFDPRHATDLTVFEAPAALNQWQRLVVQANTDLSAFLVTWCDDVPDGGAPNAP